MAICKPMKIFWIGHQLIAQVEPEWIKPEQVSEQIKSAAIQRYQSQHLTLERIFVDAHSGRILGTLGVLLMDLVAIILVLLSISGLYIWLR